MINQYLSKAQQIVAVTIGFLLGALVLAVIINHSLDRATAYECNGAITVVQHGDTIWDIVEENCTGHTGHASYETIKLNNNTSNIQIGQTIQLP